MELSLFQLVSIISFSIIMPLQKDLAQSSLHPPIRQQ